MEVFLLALCRGVPCTVFLFSPASGAKVPETAAVESRIPAGKEESGVPLQRGNRGKAVFMF